MREVEQVRERRSLILARWGFAARWGQRALPESGLRSVAGFEEDLFAELFVFRVGEFALDVETQR